MSQLDDDMDEINGRQAEAVANFETAMRLHFRLPKATFDWAEGAPWMTDPANANGDIIDCDDFWFGWRYATAGMRAKETK